MTSPDPKLCLYFRKTRKAEQRDSRASPKQGVCPAQGLNLSLLHCTVWLLPVTSARLQDKVFLEQAKGGDLKTEQHGMILKQ